MIPNLIHFVFGLEPQFGGKPFSLVHYLAIKSCMEVNRPQKVFFYCEYEPSGEWWEKIRNHIELVRIKSPESIYGNKLYHFAHKADVIRLQRLYEDGGIYLDLDTICIRPLHDLFQYDFVIGQEAYNEYYTLRDRIDQSITRKSIKPLLDHVKPFGLCNAVMLSAKKSEFVRLWMESYQSFRSKGHDVYWNEHSVQKPFQIAKENPQLLKILGPKAFHYPIYTPLGLKTLFERKMKFRSAYIHHLWENKSWEKYLSQLSTGDILNRDTTYNLIARRFL